MLQHVKYLKAGANRTTCWLTFRPTSANQHVGPVCFGHEHVGEGKNEGKMLANIAVQANMLANMESECVLRFECRNGRISIFFYSK